MLSSDLQKLSKQTFITSLFNLFIFEIKVNVSCLYSLWMEKTWPAICRNRMRDTHTHTHTHTLALAYYHAVLYYYYTATLVLHFCFAHCQLARHSLLSGKHNSLLSDVLVSSLSTTHFSVTIHRSVPHLCTAAYALWHIAKPTTQCVLNHKK